MYKNLRDAIKEDTYLAYSPSFSLTGCEFQVLKKCAGGLYNVRLLDGLEILVYPEEIFYLGLEF